MNSKWTAVILAAAALAVAGWFYVLNHQTAAELANLRAENQSLREAKATLEEQQTNRATVEAEELGRLRKDNQDLLRLRNEIRQLRMDKQQLGQQVQTAQTEAQQAQARAQGAQAQVQAMQSTAQAAASQPQPPGSQAPAGVFTKEQLQFSQRYGLAIDASTATAACINNLRQIDGAKQQWALEKGKTATAVPQTSDLAPYLRNATPVCPAGGTYTYNDVATPPTCSQPGHALGK